MFLRAYVNHRESLVADAIVAALIASVIYAIVRFAGQWDASFNPTPAIDLRISALPLYTLYSTLRGVGAYLLSMLFAIVVGYWAAKSKTAERFIIPALDILQSIPVLGFLPGLVLCLVACFPRSNIGLELAAVLMIFTGQAWNIAFAFYASLKSVPKELKEAASVMNFPKMMRLFRLELPFASVNLVWNSVMSMAGGWFFITVCEAFTLGDKQYRLPGLGSYMAAAIDAGNLWAMSLALLAMTLIIVGLDLFLWRPMLALVHRFRLENEGGLADHEPLMRYLVAHSSLVQNVANLWGRFFPHGLWNKILCSPVRLQIHIPDFWRFRWILFGGVLLGCGWGSFALIRLLLKVSLGQWMGIFGATGLTFLRVFGALTIATLWTVPLGIWLARDPKRLHVAQPITQLLASFPAPMLYPIAMWGFFKLGIGFGLGAMFLMLFGVQWYILFNTLAGGMRIPHELGEFMNLAGSSTFTRWFRLYLPAVFPALTTGLITAAGGAWNASIVAEYLSYGGKVYQAHGLGALISDASARGDFALLAACLVVMVVVVVMLNRLVWRHLYRLSQHRFRLDF